MAATFNWCQDNGTATGSPAHGTTRSGFGSDTHYPTTVSYKNADDCTDNGGTPQAAAPIFWGNNSYTVFMYGHFSGTFTAISAGLVAHTAGAFATGLTLKGTVTSTYATPSTTTNAALTTDMTSPTAIGSGLTVNFATSGPENASPTGTLSAAGYSQYIALQLQTTVNVAPPGSIGGPTLMLQYNES